ncbi:unnamed protein product [Allacma fusca]|uniref:SH2 domain-containing protein n=1 Tax=Allacma fusca TaxID=39272 RepID=A0A8J2KUJ2_9HEXA|nr:unnamed protein product [Allacma fusca]
MALLEAVRQLHEGPQHDIDTFYEKKFQDRIAVSRKLREIAAEFLERTLLAEVEDPVEVEIINWYREFQNSLQSRNYGDELLKQNDFFTPRKWHTEFKSCLKHELKILSDAWVSIAKIGLQKCNALQEQLFQNVSNIVAPEDLHTVTLVWGWPNPSKTLPTEQELRKQINEELDSLVRYIYFCVPVLLEHCGSFRPSYFSSQFPDFKEKWGTEYRWRLRTINNIKAFLRNVLVSSAAWRHVSHCSPTDSIQRIHHLIKQVNASITKITSQAMIVTQQPHGTIKKESKFDLEIRMFGEDFLKVDQVCVPKITVITETHAESLHRDGILTKDILNGCGKLQSTKPSPKLPTATYNDKEQWTNVVYERMSIPKRPHNGSRPRAVLKETFFILFHTELTFDGEPVHVWTCSTPFVYTTNTSQECEGNATIFWDMYVFYKDPFNLSSARVAKVWQVQAALCRYIQNESGVSWELNRYSLKFLIQKLLGYGDFNLDDSISRAALDEDRDQSGQPFWKWFMGAIKLIKEDLDDHWEKEHIGGFLDRDDAENIIKESQYSSGTFLLRFSSSQLGALSLVWKNSTGTFSTILPKNEKGLLVGGINKLIADTESINTLLVINRCTGRFYQLLPKCEVFTNNSPVNSPERVPANGKKPYVKALMMLSLGFSSLMQRKSSDSPKPVTDRTRETGKKWIYPQI